MISRLVTKHRVYAFKRHSSRERIVLRRASFGGRGRKEGERWTSVQVSIRRNRGKESNVTAEKAGTGSNWRSRLLPEVPHRLLIRYSNQNTWREYSLLADSRRTYATPRTSFPLIGSVIVITLALQKSIFIPFRPSSETSLSNAFGHTCAACTCRVRCFHQCPNVIYRAENSYRTFNLR